MNHGLRIGVLLAGTVLLGGCNNSNIKPGDWDYPVLNPHPTHTFRIYGTMDPRLNIKFAVNWTAADQHCIYPLSVIEGAYADFHVGQPVPAVRHGNHFEVTIPTDGVLPGRCKWQFAGVLIYTGKSQDPASAGFIMQTNSPTLRPGDSPESFANFDCHLRPQVRVNGRAISGIPCTAHGHTQRVLWWYPRTRSVELNFYVTGKEKETKAASPASTNTRPP